MPDKLFIVMPAYNEESNIESVVNAWHPIVEKASSESRLIIVDDGSTDNTYEILKNLCGQYTRLVPIIKTNSGHGATCIFAYKYAIQNDADFIFQTDSDGQTEPEEFYRFWENRGTYGFIIGERKNRGDGRNRVFVSKTLRFILYLIFGTNVRDPNTPFRLMNAKKLESILKIIPDDFFLSNVIISLIAVKKNENILWLPVSFKPRQAGVNSINFRRIIKIGIKGIKDFISIKKSIRESSLAE